MNCKGRTHTGENEEVRIAGSTRPRAPPTDHNHALSYTSGAFPSENEGRVGRDECPHSKVVLRYNFPPFPSAATPGRGREGYSLPSSSSQNRILLPCTIATRPVYVWPAFHAHGLSIRLSSPTSSASFPAPLELAAALISLLTAGLSIASVSSPWMRLEATVGSVYSLVSLGLVNQKACITIGGGPVVSCVTESNTRVAGATFFFVGIVFFSFFSFIRAACGYRALVKVAAGAVQPSPVKCGCATAPGLTAFVSCCLSFSVASLSLGRYYFLEGDIDFSFWSYAWITGHWLAVVNLFAALAGVACAAALERALKGIPGLGRVPREPCCRCCTGCTCC